MLTSLRFQSSNPPTNIPLKFPNNTHSQKCTLSSTKLLALPQQSLSSFTSHSLQQPPHYISTVGSSSLHLSHRHPTLLQSLAILSAICTTWLFYSAIPTLLAFKKAAESLEKLIDTTRDELPHTMAAIRLSGMEISDLTTELSDLGQEITQGVKSSTRTVRLAEQSLRRLTTMTSSSSASLQGMEYNPKTESDLGAPAVARTARGVREGIIKGRGMLRMFFSIAQFSTFAFNFTRKRGKR